MGEVKFHVFIGADQVIRPPAGVVIPGGEVEVTVRAAVSPPASEEDGMARTREWLLGLAREAEGLGVEMPSDMAENHDHYAHGKPKP